MQFLRFAMLAAAAAAFTLPAAAQTATTAPMSAGMPNGRGEVKVTLSQQNSSGQAGTAYLIPDGKKTRIFLAVSFGPKDTPQPVHIHAGSCAHLDPKPAYPLTTLQSGRSTTVVDVPLSTLQNGKYAINVHKSTSDIATYVACGDIPKATM